MSTTVTLSAAEIQTAMQGGGGTYYLGASQFTYSIPGAASVWSAYAAGEEPYNSYSIVSAAQAANFELALGMWDELIAPDFTEVADDANGSGELRVAFTDMDDATAGYAYSGTPRAPGGKVGDIWLNSDDVGLTYDPGTYGFATLLHEIGHTLGLKHPFTAPALAAEYDNGRFTVMAYDPAEQGIITSFSFDGSSLYSSRGEVTQVTPMVIDISAVQSIYGADTTTRSGNTVYAFDDDDGGVLRAIYDAGGVDAIDLSACLRDCVIDLRPGAYSSIGIWTVADQIAYWQAIYPWAASFIAAQYDADSYEWKDNLGIALTTTIENGTGGAGDDLITGNDVSNTLLGNGGNDTLEGGAGNDTLNGGAGDDTMAGGLGNDTYIVAQAGDLVVESAGEGSDEVRTARLAYALTANVEALTGTSAGGQRLTGNALANTITGSSGNDTLNGAGGNDTMLGGLGDDTYIVAQTGDIVVEGAGGGTDTVRASVDHTLSANVENLFLGGTVGRTGTGNALGNWMRGSTGDDTLHGLDGNDDLFGLNGDDALNGGAGDDELAGGGGKDTLDGGDGHDMLQGDAGNDLLIGGAGNDDLIGGGGNDRLRGGSANDTMNGGAGRDYFLGGSGADTFVFGDGDTSATRSLADQIEDFTSSQGDRIDLSAMDANTLVGGNQAFAFIGNAAFGNVAGQLHYVQAANYTYLEGDTNGDGVADFSIRLFGTLSLAASDLVL